MGRKACIGKTHLENCTQKRVINPPIDNDIRFLLKEKLLSKFFSQKQVERRKDLDESPGSSVACICHRADRSYAREPGGRDYEVFLYRMAGPVRKPVSGAGLYQKGGA